MLPHLLDYSPLELESEFFRTFVKRSELYRLKQIYQWIFRRQNSFFGQMLNLPEELRIQLNQKFVLRSLKIKWVEKSGDGTAKFTFETHDSKHFTAVLLPHTGYHSLCISTQVGCAWKCQFCASGLVPFQRNLSSGEILDQIFLIQEELGKLGRELGTVPSGTVPNSPRIKNILFMGMGEPLANYPNLVKTVQWLIYNDGFKMSPSHVTLSTTGVVPQIKKIAQEHFNINLALSLHSADDNIRKKIMPVSSKFSIKDVLGACKFYQAQNNGDLTIEYILLDGVNDSLLEAQKLSQTLHSVQFKTLPKINLIPYNPVPTLPYKPSKGKNMAAFFNFLKSKNFIVHTRKPQGQDIGAACGQLS